MQPASHDYHTLEPDSAHQENQPQYEVPVPQQHNVYKSNEVGKRELSETFLNEWLYISSCRNMQHITIGDFMFQQRYVTLLMSLTFRTLNFIVIVSHC